MSEPVSGREFDLSPHPRILPMLGEINLVQWRCLAELVDNSIDAFLAADREGRGVGRPEVHIQLPTTDAFTGRISIRDNGPGMTSYTLENAVRAGWSGNDPINNLGMFGMGFNIATARLGIVTHVWTTRESDPEWYGLEIDFDKLQRQRHFRTPMKTRPKIDPHEQGTEITIERLKAEQRQYFARQSNRSKIVAELGRAYSAMLRPNGVPISFQLFINGVQVKGRDHCVWGGDGNPERVVQTTNYGQVNAYQVINRTLPDRKFCNSCWQWLPQGESECPSCGSSNDVVVRPRRVYGWLGVQRYLSGTDYGIDFVRHGRKIETANRDLFVWSPDESQTPEIEYPTDDPRNRGRLVGEIHLDHCRVSYTKDRFDRNDPAWDEMVEIVRGQGPLRPQKAEQLGFPKNESPLSLLFQAFRRSSPKPKVAGCYAKLLIVPDNDRAEDMAKKFYSGEADYQTDAKWWELVEEADRQLLLAGSPPMSGASEGLEGFPSGGSAGAGSGAIAPLHLPSTGDGAATSQDGVSARATVTTTLADLPQTNTLPHRAPISSLTQEYWDEVTKQRWNVKAFAVQPNDEDLGGDTKPWTLRMLPTGTCEFLVNMEHPVFRSATMTPLDALLAQLAYSAMDFMNRSSQSATSSATFASVIAKLRDRYAGAMKLDATYLTSEASAVLSSIARSLAPNLGPDDGLALFNELSGSEQDEIYRRMAVRSINSAQQIMTAGRFLEFASSKTLLRVFESHPDLFLDGHYWNAPYATIDFGRPAATEEARARVVRYYSNLLEDAIWLAEQDTTDLGTASRERLLRAMLALELLSADTKPESE